MNQYHVQDKVFCMMHGVCIIEEIVQMKQSNKTVVDYYRLVPVMDHNCTIYSPVHSANGRMRAIKSAEDYEKVLHDAKKLKSKWEINEQKRIIKRNRAIKEGDLSMMISLIRTYHKSPSHALNGDDMIWFKKAEQILVSEMIESLNITYEEAIELLYRDDPA